MSDLKHIWVLVYNNTDPQLFPSEEKAWQWAGAINTRRRERGQEPIPYSVMTAQQLQLLYRHLENEHD